MDAFNIVNIYWFHIVGTGGIKITSPYMQYNSKDLSFDDRTLVK